MEKKTSSIRGIISISFIVLMVSTLITIGYIIFSNWHTSSESIILKMENASNKDILKEIENFIHVPYNMSQINHTIIANGIVDLNNKNERDAFFASTIKSSNENIYSFSYGLENGDFYGARRNSNNDIELYRSNAETNGHSFYYSITEDMTEGRFVEDFGKFDPRTRPWYSLTKEAGKPTFAPLYKHFIKDDLVLNSAYPIYNKEGNLQGVLGTRITLSSLNEYLKEVVTDRMATAYVVERNSGELVANSLDSPSFQSLSNGTYKRISIDTIENKAILEAYENYKKTAENKVIKKTENGNLHIKLTEYKQDGIDWLIITAIPDGQFTAKINKNIQTAIVLSIMALLLSMIIYKKMTDVILRPIHNLIQVAEKFSKGELLQRAKIYKNDEIGKLSHVFNIMAEQLYKHINHLEEKVKERTTEIEKANMELKYAKIEADKANEAKSEFLANMSHEIRTPLNAVIGFSELLSNTIKDEKQQNYIKTINIAGNSLLLIINDILDLSKVEAGKMDLYYKPINMNAIFKEVETIFMQKVHSKEIEFLVDIQDDLPELILFDEVRIRQILLNLVGNAVKFTEKGYVKLSIKALPSKMNDMSSVDLHLSVEDTGIGIPETETEKIFEAFTQISGQSIKKYGGTGLGLSITQKLVEMMNGKISIESEVGKGSIFHIEFANVQIATTESLPEEMDSSYFWKYKFANETILIVDDIETNRFLLKELLSKAGIRVILAENGDEALKACELEKPGLIITDLVMPVMDGFEFSTKLKENLETREIPIIALSASTLQDLPEGSEFDEYLMKPVNTAQLLRKISQFIHKETCEDPDMPSKNEGVHMNGNTVDPEVLADIRDQLDPLLKKLETSIIIGSVKNLAQRLISLGQQHQSEFITAEGKELMSYAECYDIVNIKLKLRQIEKILSRG
ncbi:response regulator [Bacillus sp. V3B]|uniref:hybrid sensor histidine kinase/response regulator n=1 Tax=Bacillus sp. V3B TaxID=2804915 RepID=UPI00210D2A3C|nr:hybrid sensor histidine kinase/response regulator [Bacillus sp. V3B]MCQ6277117.1 response regulator [Bacillus sp. V3B]